MLLLLLFVATFRQASCGCRMPEVDYVREMEPDVPFAEDGTVPHLGVLFVTCQNNKHFNVYCTQNQVWSAEVKCNAPARKCPEQQLAPGVKVYEKGDSRVFQCDSYLRLVGESSATCVGNQWDVTFPLCERSQSCEDPKDAVNGSWTAHKAVDLPGFGPDDKAVYSCNAGFFLSRSHNELELTCLVDGSWDRKPPLCHVDREQAGCSEIKPGQVTCPDPGNAVNGDKLPLRQKIRCGKNFLVGDTLTYRCHDGYIFRNEETEHRLTCLDTGRWDSEDHICYLTTSLRCKDPGFVDHSSRIPKDIPEFGFKTGQEVAFRCDSGYAISKYTDNAVITCLENRGWDTDAPPCEKIVCPRPNPPVNGKIFAVYDHKQDFYVNDSIVIICNEGYRLEGQTKLTCTQARIGWDALVPKCKAYGRQTTPGPWRRTSRPTKTVTQAETTDFPPVTATPNSNGVQCPDPGKVRFSTRVDNQRHQGIFYQGDSVTFSCEAGYTLSRDSDKRIICGENGHWNKRKPRCILVSCSGRCGAKLDKSKVCQCNIYCSQYDDCCSDYHSLCTTGGPGTTDERQTTAWPRWRTSRPTDIVTWTRDTNFPSVTETPNLRDFPCPDPGEVDFSERRVTQKTRTGMFYSGDSLTYNCIAGFSLNNVDSKHITCTASGDWDKPKPRCIPISKPMCGDPGTADHATRRPQYISKSTMFTTGDEVEYSCNRGYQVEDFWEEFFILECDETGKWTGELPVCAKIWCIEPDIPRHGSFFPKKKEYETGEEVTFECDPGYELRGRSTIECSHEFGDWSGVSPTCKVAKCPIPSWPENGWRIGNNYQVGQSVSFECTDGYTLIGSQTRTCLPSKRWSGTTAVCDLGKSFCPPLATPVGGYKDGNSYNYGNVVKFSCSYDFYLTGSESRTCLRNKVWSGSDTQCIYENDFDDVNKTISDLQMEIDTLVPRMSNSTCRDTKQWGAIDLYIIMAVSKSINQSELQASKEFSKLIVEKLSVSALGVNVGVIVFNSEVEDVVRLGEGLSVDEVKNRIDRINVTGGGRATASALRYLKEEVKSRAHTTSTKRVAIVITNGKYTVGGSPVPIADELKQSPYNMDIYCVGYGQGLDKKSLYGIVSSSEKFWAIPNESYLGIITEGLKQTDPNDYSECGVGGLINISEQTKEDGSRPVSDIRHWPWVGMIYHNEGNATAPCTHRSLRFLCGASLIHPQWLLTSRSCLVGFQDPRYLHVKLGSNFEDASGVLVDVSSVISEPYSRDIALVKMTEPVVLTPKIRPVCLPWQMVKDSQSVPVTWGSAVGFGDEQSGDCDTKITEEGPTRKSPRQLHLTTIRRFYHRACKKWTPTSQLFFKRSHFCASSGTGRAAMTTKGFPFMTQTGSRTDTDRGRVVQTGVLSWATNCRGYYIKVGASLGWIQKVTEIKHHHTP